MQSQARAEAPRIRIPVAVLGATGLVGQRFVSLLAEHPWFELVGVAASDRSAGQRYADAVRWRLDGEIPPAAAELRLTAPEPEAMGLARVVFSALPTREAEEIEPRMASAGALVFSNASAYREAPDVPLVVPEINAGHLAALDVQRVRRGWTGAIITNGNCSAIGLTLALAPLRQFGLRRVLVTTLQAASGAGYPGVPSLDLVDNVVPYIAGEEEKIASETRKILGGWSDGAFQPLPPAELRLSATCTRVPVRDGHLEVVSVELAERVDEAEIVAAWRAFVGEPQRLGLPSAPTPAIMYREEPDRPQPQRDRRTGGGMAVTIGRLSRCDVLDYRFVCLSHNTIRGAAGASVLNAELAQALGLIA